MVYALDPKSSAGLVLIVVDVIVPDVPLVLPPPYPLFLHVENEEVLYDDVSAASNHTTQFVRHCGVNGNVDLVFTELVSILFYVPLFEHYL